MVAEAIEAQASKPKRPSSNGRAPDIPVLTVSRIRNLYLGHCLGAKEIADQVGLPADSVRNLLYRRGWTKLRKSREAQIEAKAIARADESVEEIVQAVAMESEALALGTLQTSHGVLADVGKDPDAPRNLQALSQAAKNFVGLFRQARNLDTAKDGSGAVNVLFISCARAGVNDAASLTAAPVKAEPINVTPVTAPSSSASDSRSP
jgi:hypothetical protein